jgi:hypothetical protein
MQQTAQACLRRELSGRSAYPISLVSDLPPCNAPRHSRENAVMGAFQRVAAVANSVVKPLVLSPRWGASWKAR